jgi:hypothetical protein
MHFVWPMAGPYTGTGRVEKNSQFTNAEVMSSGSESEEPVSQSTTTTNGILFEAFACDVINRTANCISLYAQTC